VSDIQILNLKAYRLSELIFFVFVASIRCFILIKCSEQEARFKKICYNVVISEKNLNVWHLIVLLIICNTICLQFSLYQAPLQIFFYFYWFHHVFPILSVILTKYHYIILTDKKEYIKKTMMQLYCQNTIQPKKDNKLCLCVEKWSRSL
jgi:hypothetical protein